jgi:hypothetical protein
VSGGGGGGLEARVRELWVRLAQMEAEKIKVIVPFHLPVLRIRNMFFGPPPGSGSSRQRYPVRIQILLSSSKNSKKNIDSYCFVTSV